MEETKKVVAIAGASSGMGKATALLLAHNGYKVSIAARRENLLQEIADKISKEGGSAYPCRADLTIWEDASRFIRETYEHFKRIDVLINNVGSGIHYTAFENLSIEEINRGIAVNLTSVLYGCKAVIPYMKRQKSGHIINTTSILGKRARSGLAVYTAGKHGVDGFSRALFNEVKKYGIKVSIIGPAMVNTKWAEKAGITNLFAKGKIIEPEDVAHVIRILIETPLHYTVWSIDLMALSQTIDPL